MTRISKRSRSGTPTGTSLTALSGKIDMTSAQIDGKMDKLDGKVPGAYLLTGAGGG